MRYEIKNRWDGKTIYADEAESLVALVSAAVKAGANLSSANLRRADLYGANLRRADLYGADLRSADLYGADLYGANLYGANLRSANLSGADLRSANLRSADLHGANLRSANGLYPIVPEVGAFIGFKKLSNGVIAKLQIPEDAERVGGFIGRKCRASKAIVLEGEGTSSHDAFFKYVPGTVIVPDKWDGDARVECSHGIHFFITRKEAEEY
ncbi:MAG TPA: pentapeptide repeat-containing protein [Candidatus Angelobacter sp.]|nr:pentapeptide repeat-containing protein [Candidatus Angelobacter sp.]